MSFVKSDLGGALPLVASGKVRELYEIDEKTLLFVATDRISAYDVIMANVSDGTSVLWYNGLTDVI
jgi:phosphoribosylaminoimidazole-succinocarboxamide synthase